MFEQKAVIEKVIGREIIDSQIGRASCRERVFRAV